MTYQETIEWLFVQLPTFASQGPGAYKPGLETTRRLTEAFGNPQEKLRFVHVAGTNGKGSVSHTLAAALVEEGYKVGLYTSPHLVDFRERIMVGGKKVPEEFVVDFVKEYQRLKLEIQPTFFELTTIMALKYFETEGVEWAVMETGLGGRLDSTNIIRPELCVITNISKDHTALLGLTEEEIAFEKAGIIKDKTPVVVGHAQGKVREVFQKQADEKGAHIVFAEDSPVPYRIGADGKVVFEKCGYDFEYDLMGGWQAENGNTALHALEFLPVSIQRAVRAMENVSKYFGLMGRWQTLQAANPTVVCDTGHNPGAWQYLGPRLQEISEKQPLRIVLGFANDKDINSIMDYLPKRAEYYFVKPSVKRGAEASKLLEMAQGHGLKGKAFDTVKEGYEKALSASGKGEFVFVGGSNYVIADLKAFGQGFGDDSF